FLERVVTDALIMDGQGRAFRNPGGFAAWDQQRRASGGRKDSIAAATRTATPSASAGSASGSAPATSPAGSGRKRPSGGSGRSASTIGHQLRQAEKDMARLERSKTKLEAALVDAGEDHEALARLGAELGQVSEELASTEERWMELAEEQENRG
ncbi:MAG: ABC transporter C-terminal domain-containing protein, partial [Actinomycetota bacterium]